MNELRQDYRPTPNHPIDQSPLDEIVLSADTKLANSKNHQIWSTNDVGRATAVMRAAPHDLLRKLNPPQTPRGYLLLLAGRTT